MNRNFKEEQIQMLLILCAVFAIYIWPWIERHLKRLIKQAEDSGSGV